MFGLGRTRLLNAPTRRQTLDGVAVVSVGVRAARENGRTLLVRSPAARPPARRAWAAWLRPPLPEQRFALDELGVEVFELIDGRRTVRQTVDVFAGRHRLNRREAELSVAAFLRLLMQRGLIAVALPKAGGARNGTTARREGSPRAEERKRGDAAASPLATE